MTQTSKTKQMGRPRATLQTVPGGRMSGSHLIHLNQVCPCIRDSDKLGIKVSRPLCDIGANMDPRSFNPSRVLNCDWMAFRIQCCHGDVLPSSGICFTSVVFATAWIEYIRSLLQKRR